MRGRVFPIYSADRRSDDVFARHLSEMSAWHWALYRECLRRLHTLTAQIFIEVIAVHQCRLLYSCAQDHPVAVGNRPSGSARASAKLQCPRNGPVQHLRSNPHEVHARELSSVIVVEQVAAILGMSTSCRCTSREWYHGVSHHLMPADT